MTNRPEPAPGVLYLVGTPIGNLGDLSPRAKSILEKVSAIACEDTRHSLKLVNTLKIKVELISFHKNNQSTRTPQIIKLLQNKKSIALISDAGLPGISDPGEELVTSAKKIGIEVICIPGPCAATTALICSGLPTNRFCFEGFLPAKGKERIKRLNLISIENRTSIIYESPHRLNKLLEELSNLCGENRSLQVARELTKKHEEMIGDNIGQVIKHFSKIKPRGEFTLVIGGLLAKNKVPLSEEVMLEEMNKLIETGLSSSEAAKLFSKDSGISRRLLYNLLHKLKVTKSQKIDNIKNT